MKEIISVSIGNAGTNVGLDYWELLCLEAGIDSQGKFNSLQQNLEPGNYKFFSETSTQTYTPRALFIDTDPQIFSILNTKPLFYPTYTISGTTSLRGNYAKGFSSKYYNNESISLIDASLESLRNIAENSDNFEGFIITHSVAGGTGSSLTSILLNKLSEEYPKKIRTTVSVMPSENNNELLEPYNVMHCMNNLIENADATFSYDNDALNDICRNTLGIENPEFESYNHLIAHSMSSITCSMRNDGSLNTNLSDYMNNLVPYPPIHFLITSQFPLWPLEKTYSPIQYNGFEVVFEVFNTNYFMTKCETSFGKYMAASLQCRGDYVPKDICCAMSNVKIRRRIEFVDWCPTGLKCGIDYKIPEIFPKSEVFKIKKHIFLCCNNSAISDIFNRVLYKFDVAYANKVCLDKLGQEGFDDEILIKDRERINMQINDYEEALKEVEDDEIEV
ncbi:hypothetical protein SteCoe_30109 [Stentor coeruleus]|uniref:Tubulin/FtsZ GTPase domain-containing protein n=1 Tax=Stentor coeruleus TaxID=5963 RepID=A0A1R2B4L4_9CILI|nr:hypothetical protein SteCoe_30109 [Stentor coeruleus]